MLYYNIYHGVMHKMYTGTNVFPGRMEVDV